MTTRDRVTDFAHRHASDQPRDSNVQVAAAEVGQTLDYLGFAVEDVECARVDYISAKERCEAAIAAGGSDDGQERFEAQRRAYFLLQYRIDTFFFFARVLLDDVVTLIDVGCAPSGMKIGSHSKHREESPSARCREGRPDFTGTLEDSRRTRRDHPLPRQVRRASQSAESWGYPWTDDE